MTEQMLTRLPAALKDKLRSKAERLGVTINALVLQILWNYFEQREDKQ